MKFKLNIKNQLFIINKKIILLINIVYLLILLFIISSSDDKISIIIPTYNREKLLIRSIKSILNQTYQNFEIIIVDDFSKDNTKNIINIFNDNRIRYIRLRKNKGASFARNIGIKKATGKYISFQDSDDIFHFDKLEKQINNLIKHDSDFDFCKICVHFSNNNLIIFPNNTQEKEILNKNVTYELCNGNFISTQSILVKKYYIEKYLFDPKFPKYQDYDLVLRMVPNIKVSYTKHILVDLYRQQDSISWSQANYNKAMDLLLKKKYNIICDKNQTYYDIFKK